MAWFCCCGSSECPWCSGSRPSGFSAVLANSDVFFDCSVGFSLCSNAGEFDGTYNFAVGSDCGIATNTVTYKYGCQLNCNPWGVGMRVVTGTFGTAADPVANTTNTLNTNEIGIYGLRIAVLYDCVPLPASGISHEVASLWKGVYGGPNTLCSGISNVVCTKAFTAQRAFRQGSGFDPWSYCNTSLGLNSTFTVSTY